MSAYIYVTLKELWPNGDWAFVCPDHAEVKQYASKDAAARAFLDHLEKRHVRWTVHNAVQRSG